MLPSTAAAARTLSTRNFIAPPTQWFKVKSGKGAKTKNGAEMTGRHSNLRNEFLARVWDRITEYYQRREEAQVKREQQRQERRPKLYIPGTWPSSCLLPLAIAHQFTLAWVISVRHMVSYSPPSTLISATN
jgi:hypothetical protein